LRTSDDPEPAGYQVSVDEFGRDIVAGRAVSATLGLADRGIGRLERRCRAAP
jgi:hypothetical protein